MVCKQVNSYYKKAKRIDFKVGTQIHKPFQELCLGKIFWEVRYLYRDGHERYRESKDCITKGNYMF
jgi:hypothetical protein